MERELLPIARSWRPRKEICLERDMETAKENDEDKIRVDDSSPARSRRDVDDDVDEKEEGRRAMFLKSLCTHLHARRPTGPSVSLPGRRSTGRPGVTIYGSVRRRARRATMRTRAAGRGGK